jgi:hypothetical protein
MNTLMTPLYKAARINEKHLAQRIIVGKGQNLEHLVMTTIYKLNVREKLTSMRKAA